VLWVGTDEPRKNLACLIDAVGRVRARGCDVRLTICGDNPDLMVRHRSSIGRAGLGDRLDVLGYLPDNALAREYRRARVFVCPSSYEGFGLPVLEAMASGAPVVCSTAAALPETAGDAARFFDPDDPAALADEIVRCLTEPAMTADLSARGRARARQFTWEETARRLLSAMDMTCRTSV
jgi:glycosyltransferase involved in cell wall biosynthesis